MPLPAPVAPGDGSSGLTLVIIVSATGVGASTFTNGTHQERTRHGRHGQRLARRCHLPHGFDHLRLDHHRTLLYRCFGRGHHRFCARYKVSVTVWPGGLGPRPGTGRGPVHLWGRDVERDGGSIGLALPLPCSLMREALRALIRMPSLTAPMILGSQVLAGAEPVPASEPTWSTREASRAFSPSDRQTRLRIDRFQTHQTHQPLHSFEIDPVSFALQPGGHASAASKRMRRVLPVDHGHQCQVRDRLHRRLVVVG